MRLKWQGPAEGTRRRGNERKSEQEVNKVRLHPWIAAGAVAACAFAGVPGSTSSSLGLLRLQRRIRTALQPCRSTPASGAWTSPTLRFPLSRSSSNLAAKETEFQDALDHYTYRRTARVEVLDDDNKVNGEWYEVDDVIFDPDGRAYRKSGFCAGRARWSRQGS